MNLSRARFLRYTDGDIAFALVLCLGLGIAVWQWHAPRVLQIRVLGDRLAEQTRVHKELEQMRGVIAHARASATLLETRLTGFETEVLATAGVAGRLEQLSELQDECSVDLDSVSPGREESNEWYSAVPMNIVATGTLEEALCFVDRIEESMVAAEMTSLRFFADMENEDLSVSIELRVLTDVVDRADGEDSGNSGV